jgi:Domain of unknown function (DUF1918)
VTGKVGDRISVDGKKGAAREGQILEIIPSPWGDHYRVRWNDGHESDIRPAGGSARITPAAPPKKRKGASADPG